MSEHRYNLETYKGMSTKHRCPACGKNRTFTLYIDNETQDPLNSKVGRCERVDSCGYHYTPKQYFSDNDMQIERTQSSLIGPRPVPPTSFINMDYLKRTLAGYDKNNFVSYLKTIFSQQTVDGLITRYLIGTSNYWPGSTVFWQLDTKGHIRTGKIMLYNASTGKRVKEPINHITWAHKVLKMKEYNLKQSLFGEHLLKLYPDMPVAVVESEKTAIIASAYLPKLLWLACGSLQNLTVERCSVLNGRNVMLYPDLNGMEKWSAKADQMGFKLSRILESRATDEERAQGLDIADYLIRINVEPKPIVDPELLDLREYFHDLTVKGLIPEHLRGHINSLWQGVIIYLKRPEMLSLYTGPLYQIRSEIQNSNTIEANTLNLK